MEVFNMHAFHYSARTFFPNESVGAVSRQGMLGGAGSLPVWTNVSVGRP